MFVVFFDPAPNNGGPLPRYGDAFVLGADRDRQWNSTTTDEIIAIFENETARGWRDPALVRVFLQLIHTNPDQLTIPDSRQTTQDERIFQAIAATGVIDWDRRARQGTHT